MDIIYIYIYGTGLIAKNISYHIRDEILISGYIETNPERQEFLGKPVYSPNVLKGGEFDYVVVASSFTDEIKEKLLGMGIPNGKIVTTYNQKECDVDVDLRLAVMRTVAEDLKNRGISGAVAELGVYKGGFSKYISRAFPDEKFYLFDTFEGFDSRDVTEEKAMWGTGKNIYDNGLKFDDVGYVLSRIDNPDRCIVCKGYFPETAENVDDEFVFVLIDVDLYRPIYEGLKFFYPKMKKGGCIMVHDYGSYKWKGANMAVMDFADEYGVSYLPIPDMGGSAVFVKN